MPDRSKSKTRSKGKVRRVSSLPKKAKAGEIVDMEIKKRGGGTRLQRFEAQDQVMWKMKKNPKR